VGVVRSDPGGSRAAFDLLAEEARQAGTAAELVVVEEDPKTSC
jgi:hypothetical protein